MQGLVSSRVELGDRAGRSSQDIAWKVFGTGGMATQQSSISAKGKSSVQSCVSALFAVEPEPCKEVMRLNEDRALRKLD